MDFTALRESFTNPGVEFRPVPFWFWNSKLDPDEIESQVHLMHKAGLGGFFMHARFGLETEYMGKDWMDCIRRAVQTAHQCGIKAWLYDEYPFPSGVGGLKVTRNPEYCNKFIDLVEATFVGPKEISLPIPEKPLIAYAVRTDQISDFYEKAVSIELNNDKELIWNVPEGEWLIMIFVKRVLQDPRGNVFGPDYLNTRMTQAFLSVLDTYVNDDEIKKHLGETIPGIFTDEPCLLAWHQNHTNYPARPNGRIAAWGDEIPERLERKGYDWRKILPALFYDVGTESAEFRHAYREIVAKNYIDSFFSPYQQWCHKNKLKLTGHLLLEEGLYTNTIFQGDFIRDLGLFDIPGSDHLGIGCEGKYGGWGNLPLMSTNAQGQKLVSSIAHLYGKEEVLSESFGVSGWGLSMADMKRIVDWQFRLGINFLCPHAFYYSMEGFRKYDSPPSQFFQATYWRYYRYFADYVARLSLLMRAKHVAQAALFYPQDDFWRTFKAGMENAQDRRLADQFDFYASQLPKCHLDYDIVPEQFITVDNVKNGKLKIGQEQYELIVLPAVSDYSSSLLDALASFYQEGGKLLLTAPVAGKLMDKLRSISSSKGSFDILDGKCSTDSPFGKECSTDSPFGKGGKGGFLEPSLVESLKNALSQILTPDLRISHREVTCIHRELSGKHIYFFASDSNDSLKVKLEMKRNGLVEQWDIETGQILSIPSEITDDGYTSVEWDFLPYGSLVLVLDTEREAKPEPVKVTNWYHVPLDGVWEFSCDSPNILPLDHWNIQLTTRGDWLHYDYTTDVQILDVPESILLLLDDVESRSSFMTGMHFQIFVNGHEIPHEPTGYYIDPKWKTFVITEKLNQGKNRLHIRFTNQSWAGEPKAMTIPPKLLGNFVLLNATDDNYVISRTTPKIKSGASWTKQGYPFYSGTATYSQQVNLDDLHGQVWIEAEDVADIAEFIVNGACAGVRPWAPYRCEISSLLCSGQNNIVIKVTNSMKNFLECDAKPSGLLGNVSLRMLKQ